MECVCLKPFLKKKPKKTNLSHSSDASKVLLCTHCPQHCLHARARVRALTAFFLAFFLACFQPRYAPRNRAHPLAHAERVEELAVHLAPAAACSPWPRRASRWPLRTSTPYMDMYKLDLCLSRSYQNLRLYTAVEIHAAL